MKSVNEVRAGLGLAPVAGGERSYVLAGSAALPLADIAGAANLAATNEGATPNVAARNVTAGRAGLAKDYHPDQPRVPAGSSAGGQWTGGGADGGGVETQGVPPLLGGGIAAVEALPLLGEAEAAGALSGGALAALPILLAPTHLGGAADGTLPGHPDIRYRYDETRLTLTRADADGGETPLYDGRCGLDGVFRTPDGAVLATPSGNGIAIDPAAVAGLIQARDGGRASQPSREECDQEWAEAWKYCDKLRKRRKMGRDGYRGFGRSLKQCARGMVSEACGGNPLGRR